MDTSYENQLDNWINKEKLGVDLLNSVGTLMYDKGIELVLFRNKLLEIGVSELLNYIYIALGMAFTRSRAEGQGYEGPEAVKLTRSVLFSQGDYY